MTTHRPNKAALLTLITLLWIPLPALAWELELDLGLYNRLMVQANHVERMLRYSTERQTFDVGGYLAPRVDEINYALFARASIYLEATSWLGYGLTVDSGQLKPAGRLPRYEEVQIGAASYKGVNLPAFRQQLYTTDHERKVTSNGQAIGEEARESFFIRQALVRLTAPETGWLTASVGRLAANVGGSLIYNDSALGAQLLLDLDALKDWPVRAGLKLLLPTRAWDQGLRSPLVELRVDYVFSSFLSLVESVGLTVAFFHDGDDNFGQLLEPTISEAAVRFEPGVDPALFNYVVARSLGLATESKANIVWIGLSGRKLLGDLLLSANLMLELGKLTLRNPFYDLVEVTGGKLPAFLPQDEQLKLSTLGFAGELTATYLISEDLSLGGFFLLLSGDENPYGPGTGSSGRYGSFLSVVPYITHTNLFFSGGMNETFSGRQASTSGINGRGVIAGGPNFAWEITDGLDVGATAAVLFAPVSSPGGGHFYGFELDLSGSWEIFEFLKVSAQYDMLAAGNFFAHKAVVHQFLLGLDVVHER